MGEIVLNSRELVDQLWREAQRRREVEAVLPSLDEVEPLQHNHVLRHINVNWQLDTSYESRGGPRARVKRRLATFVLSVLQRYFDDERDFLAHTVRLHNESAARTDQLTENIRRLDEGLREAMRLLADRDDRFHRLVDQRLAAIEDRVAELER